MTVLLKFLPILFTFSYLFLIFPIPVYAHHCGTPREAELVGGTYCDKNSAGADEIWRDLDCSLPEPHEYIGTSCDATTEECVPGDPNADGAARVATCEPRGTARAPTSANDAAGLQQIEDVFKNVVSAVVGLGFVASLIILVLAGIKYLTSGGEPKAIQSAHQTVTWALLGILFMAVGWIILQLIHSFTGIDVTIFDIRKLCQIFPDPIKCSP